MVITSDMMIPRNDDDAMDAIEKGLEWRRCLIWLAIQANLFTDAALMAVYNDMLPDERVMAYYKVFPKFRSEVRRITKTPEDWNKLAPGILSPSNTATS